MILNFDTMAKKIVIETHSAEETIKLGKKLAKHLKPGIILILAGELGAGKTTLIKGIAMGLGVSKVVRSPSFTLVKEYPEKKFYHLDLYRITLDEFLQAGFEQYLSKENICAIEWGEKLKGLKIKNYMEIQIKMKKGDTRVIDFVPHGNYAPGH